MKNQKFEYQIKNNDCRHTDIEIEIVLYISRNAAFKNLWLQVIILWFFFVHHVSIDVIHAVCTVQPSNLMQWNNRIVGIGKTGILLSCRNLKSCVLSNSSSIIIGNYFEIVYQIYQNSIVQ